MRHEEAAARLGELVGLRRAGDEERALRAHVAACTHCAGRLQRLERIERALRAARPLEPPTPSLSARVAELPMMVPPRRRRGRARLWAALAAAATLAAATLGVLFATSGSAGFTPRQRIGLAAADGLHARLEVGAPSGANQPLRLEARSLPPGTYTLWVIAPSARLVAGSFRPDADGDCSVLLTMPRRADWRRVAITRAGRAPIGRDVLARGTIRLA